MSKRKRGLTVDEKRDKLLNLLQSTKEVYVLKDLEKLGAKEGVVAQTVKEVLALMESDGVIELEKIGASNYYWSFPSKAYRVLQNRIEAHQREIAEDEAAITALKAKIAALESERPESADRSAKLARVAELEEAKATTLKQLDIHKHNDPQVLRALSAKIEMAQEAANRWTDNIWALRTFLMNSGGGEPGELDKALGITDNFDYPVV